MVAQETSSFNIYKVNLNAKPSMPTKWNKTPNTDDLTKLKIYVNNTDYIEARNLNFFTNYVLTFYNAELINKWLGKCDMSFYQNQLNFAVWCATSGCGVSSEHLTSKENLISSVFRFHVYYQTRKILEEMSCPIPGDQIFSTTDNHINLLKYQKLCNEFNVPSTDFRFKGGENGGLGTMYNFWTHSGYHALHGEVYDPKSYQFLNQSEEFITKIDYVYQEAAVDGWKQFIEDKAEGFTRAGAVRIDDSIRNYVHCVLGSQAQTRSNIIKSLETQQYFVDLLEENIKSMFSIPESIAKYQDAITKTNSRIDYVVAIGMYMIPSDLVLKVGTLVGYNNNIVIATTDMKIGQNEQVNKTSISISINNLLPVKEDRPITQSDTNNKPAPVSKNVSISPVYLSLGVSLLMLLVFYGISQF